MTRRIIIFRTGLAFMLAGFVVFVSGDTSSPEAYAYDGPPIETDSAILARHIREVKVMYAVEEFSDHSFNSHLSERQLDSLFALSGHKIVAARVVYSTDSAFKMVSVGLESCEGFCNTTWWTWMHFTYDVPLESRHSELHEILSISMLPDGKYLFLDQERKTSSNGTVLLQHARLFELDRFEYTGHYNSFPGTPSVILVQDTIDGLVLRNTYLSDRYQPFLQYDSANYRLNYQYSTRINEQMDYDYAHVYSGYFLYENGTFIHQEEDRLILAD